MPPEKNTEILKDNIWRKPLVVFGRMSGWIVFPIVASLLFGKLLDSKFGTGQIIFLSLGVISVIVTIFGIWREAKQYIKSLDEENTENKNDNIK